VPKQHSSGGKDRLGSISKQGDRYTSPAGPITPLDMLFGHSDSIASGHLYMAHKTGFTCASLGRHFVDADFPIVLVKQDGLNLWALGLMQEADQANIQRKLLAAGLDLSEQIILSFQA